MFSLHRHKMVSMWDDGNVKWPDCGNHFIMIYQNDAHFRYIKLFICQVYLNETGTICIWSFKQMERYFMFFDDMV